ncbi:MAG: adenylosuccinate synthase [Pseudomonadota bacterium]
MSTIILIGAQWGDEGKGKIVDFLSREADMVVRFQGGNNAGHTVIVGGRKIVLHQIPSGILRRSCVCVIGNGVVLNVPELAKEIELLKKEGYPVTPKNLRISGNAHLILPYHMLLDRLSEERLGARRVGTTGRGIGPTYVDKASREGIRAGELLSMKWFEVKLKQVLEEKNRHLSKLYGEKELDAKEIVDEYAGHAKWFAAHVANSSVIVDQAYRKKKNVLFEGAQGTSLDVDHGTYPYVTSSNTVAAAACIGAGIGPTAIDRVIGVTKAYTTRVGEGPFPTELQGAEGDELRARGQEFGATTGRPRRCGWLDAVLLRHAVRVNGITDLAVTKLDILNGFKTIKIATAYERQGEVSDVLIPEGRLLAESKPIYEELPGWKTLPKKAKKLSDLPVPARRFLKRIEALTKTRVSLVSTGAERSAQIVVRDVF